MDDKGHFWKAVEESVARLRADPKAWQEYQKEIRLLEGGSMDGQKDEEPYYSDSEFEAIVTARISRPGSSDDGDFTKNTSQS